MHADLIKRLESLEGPDREVDADIYIAFHIPPERVGRINRLGGCVGWWPKDAPYVLVIGSPVLIAMLYVGWRLVARVFDEVGGGK